MNLNDKFIGKKIIFYRKRYGLTQRLLAIRIGVSKRTIINWENTKTFPNDVYIYKLKMEGII